MAFSVGLEFWVVIYLREIHRIDEPNFQWNVREPK
jgi:hypothetical protein